MKDIMVFIIILSVIGAITTIILTYYTLKWKQRYGRRATDDEMYESYKESYEKDPSPFNWPPEIWKIMVMEKYARIGRKWTGDKKSLEQVEQGVLESIKKIRKNG